MAPPQATVFVDTFSQNGVERCWNAALGGNVAVGFNGAVQFRASCDSAATFRNAMLVLSLSTDGLDTGVAPAVSGAGWSFDSVSVSGGIAAFVFIFTGEVPASGQSSTLTYTLYGNGSPLSAVTPKLVSGLLWGNFGSVTKSTSWT